MTSLAQNIFDLGVSLNRVAAEQVQERRLLHIEKSGPAWSEKPDPETVALAIIRSGFETLLEARYGRPLSVAEHAYCQTQAELAIRREDDAQYQDDKGDAAGDTLRLLRNRPSFDVWPDWQILEAAHEAISAFKVVEVKAVRG